MQLYDAACCCCHRRGCQVGDPLLLRSQPLQLKNKYGDCFIRGNNGEAALGILCCRTLQWGL